MKKLISAATSLVMAASMASAVVPFATGAAALKTLEIRPFNGASTTVDASAGDVKVPIGIYLKENTPTSDFISAQITVKSSNGDPKDVEFTAIKPGAAKYFAEATGFTGADGETYNITQAPGFAGELKHGSSRDIYTATGTGVYNNDSSYALAGADYAFASTAWVAGNDGYKWAGATSDALPVMIVEVTFKQGTKDGDYTIEFCDYKSDSKNPEIKSCMIESDDAEGRKMTTDNGYLALGDPLKITVGNPGTTPEPTTAVVPTTAPPQEETKAPTTAAPTEGKTNAPAQGLTQPSKRDQSGAATWEKGSEMDGFVVKSGEWNVEAGKTVVIDVMVESGGIDVAQLVTRLNDRDLPTGFSVVGIGDGISDACNMVAPTPQGEFYYIDNLATDGSAQPIDDSTYVIQYEVKVDDTVPTGEYDFALSRFTVATDSKNAYEAKIIPGKIKVTNPIPAADPGTVTTQPGTTAPETKPVATAEPVTKDQSGAADWEKGPALDTFIVKSGDWTVQPGQKFVIDVMVDSGDADVAQLVTRLNDRDLPEGFKVVGIGDGISEACNMVAPTPQGEFYYIDNLATDGSAQKIDDESYVIQYEVEVASTVKPGKYDFALSRFTVAPNSKDTYEAKILPGTITVDGPTDGPTEPQVTDPGQQEDTTNGGAGDLTPTYGDVNCDGKVNIADVVILCAWMNDSSAYDMKDQNKLNADCCDEKKGTEINSNDADAILQNIIDLVSLPCKSTELKSFS